jgi:DNA-binding GntR family transcriptional regulator
MIVAGELRPGTRLTELDIAAQMGMSQGPVREALQRLEQDGLVERRARSGTFVTSISREEMYEIFSVRSVVESFAILRAAPHITAARLSELAQLVDRMRAAGAAGDILTLSDHDLRFHMQICTWSAHPMLLRVWMPLFTQAQRFIVANHPHFFPDLVEVADTHQPILDAISGGTHETAAARMREHIMLIWSRIEVEEAPQPATSQMNGAI